MTNKEIIIRNFDFIEKGNLSTFCYAYGMDKKYVNDTISEIKRNKNKHGVMDVVKPITKAKHGNFLNSKQLNKAIESLSYKESQTDNFKDFSDRYIDISVREVKAKKVYSLPSGKMEVIFESKMNYE